MKLYTLLLLFTLLICALGEIERFQTTDFNCRCDTVDGVCACYMRWADTEEQYNNVQKHIHCNRHACFLHDDGRLNCLGRVFSTLSGSKVFNPLTPNNDNKGFDLSGDTVMEIDHEFRGFNLKTAYLEYNVITKFKETPTDVRCNGPYGTCVKTASGETCFGIPEDSNFYNEFVSFILGLLIQFALAFPIFISMKYLLRNRPNALYFCSIVIAAPIAISLSVIIVNFTTDLFVKMYIYVIGSGIGIVLADLVASVLLRIIMYCCMSKVEIEMNKEQSTELISKNNEETEHEEEKQQDDVEVNVTTINLN